MIYRHREMHIVLWNLLHHCYRGGPFVRHCRQSASWWIFFCCKDEILNVMGSWTHHHVLESCKPRFWTAFPTSKCGKRLVLQLAVTRAQQVARTMRINNSSECSVNTPRCQQSLSAACWKQPRDLFIPDKWSRKHRSLKCKPLWTEFVAQVHHPITWSPGIVLDIFQLA